MTGDPVSWNRSMVSRMAASYNSRSSSSEHRPSLNSRIPVRSSGGLGMLPIGSVGMDMARNLLPDRGSALRQPRFLTRGYSSMGGAAMSARGRMSYRAKLNTGALARSNSSSSFEST